MKNNDGSVSGILIHVSFGVQKATAQASALVCLSALSISLSLSLFGTKCPFVCLCTRAHPK